MEVHWGVTKKPTNVAITFDYPFFHSLPLTKDAIVSKVEKKSIIKRWITYQIIDYGLEVISRRCHIDFGTKPKISFVIAKRTLKLPFFWGVQFRMLEW